MARMVLVAEDDASILEMIGTVLRDMRAVPICASNGKLALDILNDNPQIDLLISDVMMPGMDGRELVGILRGQERFAALPIILISGVMRAAEISKLLDMGVTFFLPKPVRIVDLKSYIARALPMDLDRADPRAIRRALGRHKATEVQDGN